MDTSRIYLSPPFQSGDEQAEIEKALASNWLAPAGSCLAEFEQALCEATGFRYAVALSSGTAAIHLGLKVLGVGSGDTVLASTLTFVGAINPITYLGAKPVFVDSEAHSWNMAIAMTQQYLDAESAQAILPTHLFGMPADVKSLERIGQSRQIPVLHDLAECIGGRVEAKKIGTLVQRGILSFNGNKMITTSGGGAFMTNDREEANQVLHLATQAKSGGYAYHHTITGYNYRMSNVLAALGLAQIKTLDKRISRKREIFERYKFALEPLGFDFQVEPEVIQSDRWLSVVLLPDMIPLAIDEIVNRMDQANIEVRPVWKPMHQQPLFKGTKIIGGSVSDGLFSKGLCLPSGCGLTNQQQDFVIDQLIKSISGNR